MTRLAVLAFALDGNGVSIPVAAAYGDELVRDELMLATLLDGLTRGLERAWNEGPRRAGSGLGRAWSGLGAGLEQAWKDLEQAWMGLEPAWKGLEPAWKGLERAWKGFEQAWSGLGVGLERAC